MRIRLKLAGESDIISSVNHLTFTGKDIMNYTYILKCRDGSLYTGWTNHLEERIQAHNEGRWAKYTRSRRPVELIYYESMETKEEAMRREYAIKHMNRLQKLRLIAQQGRDRDE